MTSVRTISLIAARDFKERIASRAFQLSTGITVIMVLAFLFLPQILGFDDPPEWRIGVVGESPLGFETQVRAVAPEDATVTFESLTDTAAAEATLLAGDLDAAIDGTEVLTTGDTSNALSSTLAATIGSSAFAQRAAELGMSPDEVSGLLDVGLVIRNVEPVDEDEEADNTGAALIGIIALFVSIVTYGQWILIGVIEEKSNRVVEVILGAVRPHHLLAGKVLGIGLLALGQLVLIIVIVIGGVLVSPTIDIPTAGPRIMAAVVLWFLLGFAFYATAYAATGSLVSRQEEAQNAAFPLTILIMAAYFVATFSFGGDNAVLRITSLIPGLSPMTMPLRMATGDAALWEVVLSVALMVAATYLLIRLAGRVYSGGLLRSGQRVKLRDAWRSAEA